MNGLNGPVAALQYMRRFALKASSIIHIQAHDLAEAVNVKLAEKRTAKKRSAMPVSIVVQRLFSGCG